MLDISRRNFLRLPTLITLSLVFPWQFDSILPASGDSSFPNFSAEDSYVEKDGWILAPEDKEAILVYETQDPESKYIFPLTEKEGLTGTITKLRNKNSVTRDERDAIRDERNSLREERNNLREERNRILNSRSWRYTKPIRDFFSLF